MARRVDGPFAIAAGARYQTRLSSRDDDLPIGLRDDIERELERLRERADFELEDFAPALLRRAVLFLAVFLRIGMVISPG